MNKEKLFMIIFYFFCIIASFVCIILVLNGLIFPNEVGVIIPLSLILVIFTCLCTNTLSLGRPIASHNYIDGGRIFEMKYVDLQKGKLLAYDIKGQVKLFSFEPEKIILPEGQKTDYDFIITGKESEIIIQPLKEIELKDLDKEK